MGSGDENAQLLGTSPDRESWLVELLLLHCLSTSDKSVFSLILFTNTFLFSLSLTMFAQMINFFPWPKSSNWVACFWTVAALPQKNLPGVVAPNHTHPQERILSCHPTIEISWKVELAPWPNVYSRNASSWALFSISLFFTRTLGKH